MQRGGLGRRDVGFAVHLRELRLVVADRVGGEDPSRQRDDDDREAAEQHVHGAAGPAAAAGAAAAALLGRDEVDGLHERSSTARPAATVRRPASPVGSAPALASATTPGSTAMPRSVASWSVKPGIASAGPVSTARSTVTVASWARE